MIAAIISKFALRPFECIWPTCLRKRECSDKANWFRFCGRVWAWSAPSVTQSESKIGQPSNLPAQLPNRCVLRKLVATYRFVRSLASAGSDFLCHYLHLTVDACLLLT